MRQPSLWQVLEPKWRTALERIREERSRGGSGRLLTLVLVGLAFWVGVYGVLYKILKYFRGVEELGPLLAGKLLGLVLLSFFAILVLSNVITALSSFFLSKDLDLLISAPVDWLRIYLAKLGETLIHSSWMVALMAVPILTAYGVIYRGGVLFAPVAVLTLVPLLMLPGVVGSAVTLVLVNVFPARRTRDLLSIVALGAAGGLIMLFRVLRPERLASPEGYRNLLDYIAVLRTPTSPFLPSEWAARATMSFLRGSPDPQPFVLLWTTAAAFVTLGAMLHRELFDRDFRALMKEKEMFPDNELQRVPDDHPARKRRSIRNPYAPGGVGALYRYRGATDESFGHHRRKVLRGRRATPPRFELPRCVLSKAGFPCHWRHSKAEPSDRRCRRGHGHRQG